MCLPVRPPTYPPHPTHPQPQPPPLHKPADPHCIPSRRLVERWRGWWNAAQPNDVDCIQHCLDFNAQPGSTVDGQCLGIVEIHLPPHQCDVLVADGSPLLRERRCYLQVPGETKGSIVTSSFYDELNAALDECGDPCRAAPPLNPAHVRDGDDWQPGQHRQLQSWLTWLASVGQPGDCSPTVKATALEYCGSGHMPPPFPPRILPPPAPPVPPELVQVAQGFVDDRAFPESLTYSTNDSRVPENSPNQWSPTLAYSPTPDLNINVFGVDNVVDVGYSPTPDLNQTQTEFVSPNFTFVCPPSVLWCQTSDGSTRSKYLNWAQWILLPLCILLAAVLVLVIRCCRLYSRRAANLRLSRDRAQMDLQLLTHQVASGGQTRNYASSVPESLPARLRAYLPKAVSAFGDSLSLPPGPPSSAASSGFRAAIELPLVLAAPLTPAAQSIAQLLRNFVAPPVPSIEVPVAPQPCVDANLPVWLAASAAAGVAPEAAGSLAAEVCLAVDAFFEQELVSEALAELATKEEAVAAQQVRAVSMSAVEALQARAAQQVRVASGDDAPVRHESPGHGSTSSEISGSFSSDHSSDGTTPESLFRTIPAKPQSLQEKFVMHVMCDFTPRPPADLPKSRWISYKRLVFLFQPFAPTEVWQHGPGNLKQLVTAWYMEHPAFAGLQPTDWCKLLKDKDAQPGSSSMVSKFSFEYTPSRKRSLGTT